MRFIYADSLDFVDPRYDFIADRAAAGREPYWDDVYPHEILGHAPYDGLLVSRATVGDHRGHGKYTGGLAMRFGLVGAREFLRYPELKYPGSWVMGDCGAFSYHSLATPPYTPADMMEFYAQAGFSHGCSVDHVIFEHDPDAKGMASGTPEARRRFEITQENARAFLAESKQVGNRFTPMGVIQGWSPDTMAIAAEKLEAMGYTYLAAGGMVPLRTDQIHECLTAIRERVRTETRLHVLGFAKADQIHEFDCHGISSFDTTSPLLRAFKDGKYNYYLPGADGRLRYYTAIRIPQALENNRLRRLVKSGRLTQESLLAMEQAALYKIRAYDRGEAELEETLEALLSYSELLLMDPAHDAGPVSQKEALKLRKLYERTLEEQPWKECSCAICSVISVEVVIFRSSNRNKRRGIHNLDVYCNHVRSTEGNLSLESEADVSRDQSAAKSASSGLLIRGTCDACV